MKSLGKVLKVVPGFTNYKVDELGNIYSFISNKNGRVLKMSNSQGYLKTRMKDDNGLWKNRKSHSIVMLAFYGFEYNNNKNLVIDHINGDKTDNRLLNLQIISQRLNSTKDKKRDLPVGVSYCKTSRKYQINFYSRNFEKSGSVKLARVNNIREAKAIYEAAVELENAYVNNKQFRVIVLDRAILNMKRNKNK